MNYRKIIRHFINLTTISIALAVISTLSLFFFGYLYISGPARVDIEEKIPYGLRSFLVSARNSVMDLKYVGYHFPESSIPIYKLQISKKDMETLDASIPDLKARSESIDYVEAIDDRLKEDDRVYVPAVFAVGEKTYRVDVRYRGSGFPHWSYEKKSMRVRFEDNDLFEGKKAINLVIPVDRDFLAEQFNNYRAERLGLTAPESRMVGVAINGQTPALYWEVEQFNEEFEEKSQLSSETDLYGEGDSWQQHIYTDLNYWIKYSEDPTKPQSDFTPLNQLLDLLNNASDEVFHDQIFTLLDEENFYAWSVHQLLAGSTHQDYSHNLRIYFDKSTGKFKLMPWDVMLYDIDDPTLSVPYAIEASENPLVQRILGNDDFMQARNKRLWEYVKDKKNLEEELAYYDDLHKSVQSIYYHDPIRLRSFSFFEQRVADIRNVIERNVLRTGFLFENADASFILTYHSAQDLTLEIAHFNSLAPVYLDKIKISFLEGEIPVAFRVYKDGRLVCQPDMENSSASESVSVCERVDMPPAIQAYDPNQEDVELYIYQIFRLQKKSDEFRIVPSSPLSLSMIDKIKFDIENSFTEKNIDVVEGVTVNETIFADFDKISATPQTFINSNHSFFLRGNDIVLPAGAYSFSANVVVPKNTRLVIEPGAVINLTGGASFVSYSPVVAKGNQGAPIRVQGPGTGKGGNMVVLDADGLSEFDYFFIDGAGDGTVNGAYFSGMLAIHHSDSIIQHSRFTHAVGDDALNIKYSSSTIRYNVFMENSFDAIDYDFSEGVVANNRFSDNGNDGVDTSGSPVLVMNNVITGSGDKCVSVGEKSTPIIFNNILDNCHIGIEIKDLSTPTILNNIIINNDIGINAYQKKEIFGGGNPFIVNSIIWNNTESVTSDAVSEIVIQYSSVQGGYDGEGNITEKPDFISDPRAEYLKTGIEKLGNATMVNERLNTVFSHVPIGLIENFQTPAVQ